MKCSEFLALLDDLIDDSLTPEVRADFEQHLRGCGHCEVILNTTRKTIEIYRSHEIYDLARRPSRTPPRRHHGALQKRLLSNIDPDSLPYQCLPYISIASLRSSARLSARV